MMLYIFSAIFIIGNFLLSFIIIKLKENKWYKEKFIIQTQFEYLTKEAKELESRKNILEEKLESEKQLHHNLKTNYELLKQQNKQLQDKYANWEEIKEKSLEHAKAAIFEIGGKLSTKLLDDHRKESENSTKNNLELVKNNTEQLHQQFKNIVESVGALRNQIDDSKKTVDLVKQALLSPSGAGSLAEITLENILKNSGLVENIDFIMQYSYKDEEKNSFRPDAVIFLTSDNVMVVDSKASKFFIELEENIDETKVKLAQSMRIHLKTLTSKSYQDSIRVNLEKHGVKTNHISMIMFLPSEIALEKLIAIDKEFLYKAWESSIYPTGPIGLVNILSHAKFQINQSKQVDNYNLIVSEVSQLLSNIGILYEHARKVGSAIQSAAVNFDKFAGSFNSKIVSKSKKIASLGVHQTNKTAELNNLSRMQIISSDKIKLIDANSESEEENEDLLIDA